MKIQNLPRANEIASHLFEIEKIFQQHREKKLYFNVQLCHSEKGVLMTDIRSQEYSDIIKKLTADATEQYFTSLMQLERALKDELEKL